MTRYIENQIIRSLQYQKAEKRLKTVKYNRNVREMCKQLIAEEIERIKKLPAKATKTDIERIDEMLISYNYISAD